MRPPEEHRGQWGGGVTKLFRLLLPDLFSVRTTQCETQNTAVSESWISGIWQSIKFKPPSGSRRPQAASLPTGSSASAWPQPMMGSPLLPAEPCPQHASRALHVSFTLTDAPLTLPLRLLQKNTKSRKQLPDLPLPHFVPTPGTG